LYRFVCAVRAQNRSVTLLRNYYSDRDANDSTIPIWKAARATSAASTFFNPIKIGEHNETYVDGAVGANNPINKLWSAAKDLYPNGHLDDRIACLVSIGTGEPAVEAFGEDLVDIAKSLKNMATETTKTADEFRQDHRDLKSAGKYFRFNVTKGLEDVALEDSRSANQIVAATRRYLEDQDTYEDLQRCRKSLKDKYGKLNHLQSA
jgi:predicted acylesterase/phospholipase RssA